jgi:poly-gamma-glutamate synthase PgsB/CapB
MAVAPQLQEVNQTKLIRSTIGVLSNVREDHVAEMGPTLDHIARSLSRSMPRGGVCVTAERERLKVLRKEADKRNCELVVVDPGSVSDEEMRGFGWFTFKENVAIALAVAQRLGVDRRSALRGMWNAPPDPGVLTVREYHVRGSSIRFANVFAANDPESTLQNIEQLGRQGLIGAPLCVLINCRPDRVERNGQMGALVPLLRPDRVVLIGEPTRSASIPGTFASRVVDLGGRRPGPELLDGVLAAAGPGASVVAVGNIHGQGEVLLDELEKLPSR